MVQLTHIFYFESPSNRFLYSLDRLTSSPARSFLFFDVGIQTIFQKVKFSENSDIYNKNVSIPLLFSFFGQFCNSPDLRDDNIIRNKTHTNHLTQKGVTRKIIKTNFSSSYARGRNSNKIRSTFFSSYAPGHNSNMN